jgi:hypothetical protein
VRAKPKNRFPFAAILLRLLNDDANQKRQSFRQRGQTAGMAPPVAFARPEGRRSFTDFKIEGDRQ